GWQVQAGKVQTGVELTWRFTTPRGEARVRIKRLSEGPPEIKMVRIATAIEKKPCAMRLEAEGPFRLAVTLEGVAGAPRTITVPGITPAELVGKQLSDRERDPVFRESMAVAQVMAQSVLG